METDHPVEGRPTPRRELSPGEAVETQLSALASNDDPEPNAGIETAYNFASRANRAATGPLARFVAMVEGPAYRPMIDHTEAVTGPVERTGDRATQTVTLTGPTGRTVTYEFALSVESEGRFADCWTTDRVVIA